MALTLVTGANRGIGFEICRLAKERGDSVVAVCRHSSSELDGLGVRVESNIDVSANEAVRSLALKLEGTRIDNLILNAGILMRDSLPKPDFEQIRKQFEVNSLGPLRVATALLPNLTKGSKVAIITSRMGSIADNSSGGYYGYRMSKAAVNMAGVSLAHDLAGQGIAVVILHPGYVRTDMTSNQGDVEPQDAARNLMKRIDELTLKTSGSFLHANGQSLPW